MLKAAPARLKVVIPGNHDITLDEGYYAANWPLHGAGSGRQDTAACRALYTDAAAREAGIVYMEEGVETFRLDNGARLTVYASAYTPEFYRWAFAYERDEDRYTSNGNDGGGGGTSSSPSAAQPPPAPPNPVPDHGHVDVMLTHGPPEGILDRTTRGVDAGCGHLARAVARCRPRIHAFGHIHEGWGARRVQWGLAGGPAEHQDVRVGETATLRKGYAYVDVTRGGRGELAYGRETLFVNASIMDVRYRPLNAPWVVDVDLPEAEEAA